MLKLHLALLLVSLLVIPFVTANIRLQKVTGLKLDASRNEFVPRTTPANPAVDTQTDCSLRALVAGDAGALQPADWPFESNWETLASAALQLQQCPNLLPEINIHHQPIYDQISSCLWQRYVDGTNGDDSNPGTLKEPFKSVDFAIKQSRIRFQNQTACITIRAGMYYFGDQSHTSSPVSSRIGALSLSAIDSGLTINSYKGEEVVFSGGRLLTPSWSVYKNTSAGTIYVTSLPSDLDLSWSRFNELYFDDWHAIRAKYPNGDPYTHGLYSTNTGYNGGAQAWSAPKSVAASTEIHVSSPFRNGTHFPYFQLGVGGGANVFQPPHNFWSTARPPAGNNYVTPSGVQYKSGQLPNVNRWSNPSTGFVHAFHCGYWGSWIFDILNLNLTSGTINFNKGGFQEARGCDSGADWYVSNIFEELDDANEWFVDTSSRLLYFMPNASTGMPKTFVASQLPCIISMHGDSMFPVDHVTISGITFTHTSNTFMSPYEVPSGGDWSFHRGASVFLEGTSFVSIDHSRFTQIAGNGVLVSGWNKNTTVSTNEFMWGGDHGVIVAGYSDGIDGVSNIQQPLYTTITKNLFTEIGAYVKQSGATYQALSRATEFSFNAVFNIPRAGININDGFAGGTIIHHNVMFNAVRETSDHGPINTWDRQPYLTMQNGYPSLTPAFNHIYRNLLLCNYGTFYPIDHDDGSAFYDDHHNVMIYGGKKNYLGHTKYDSFELYIYPDSRQVQGAPGVCIADQGVEVGISGWGEVWINNTCAMYSNGGVIYNIWYCDVSNLYTPYLAGNTFYVPAGVTAVFNCDVNGKNQGLTLKQWQSYGEDLGSVVETAPSVKTLIAMAIDILSQ